MNVELLVIADQHAAVNTFPVLYTPPVKLGKSDIPEVTGLTARRAVPKVGLAIRAKS